MISTQIKNDITLRLVKNADRDSRSVCTGTDNCSMGIFVGRRYLRFLMESYYTKKKNLLSPNILLDLLVETDDNVNIDQIVRI